MNCISPKMTWQSAKRDEHGRRIPVWTRRLAMTDLPKVPVACGKCVPCRVLKQNMMAVRIMHEASLHSQNAIIHLTFDDDHIGSPELDAVQVKRFRERLKEGLGHKPRMLLVGEYGERTRRKHYHGVLFGYDLLGGSKQISASRETKSGKRAGKDMYRSRFLDECWRNGTADVGLVGIDGAKYIAKYVVEDVGAGATVAWPRSPPLGYGWIDRYLGDLQRTGDIIIDGQNQVIPRQYLEWFKDELAKLKAERSEFAAKQKDIPLKLRVAAANAKALNRQARRDMSRGRSL